MRFSGVFQPFLHFVWKCGIVNPTIYWKEGAPEWSELLRGLLEIPRRRSSVSGSKCAHFWGYPSPSAVSPAPPKGKPLAYRAGPAEHTGLFCVNVRALSSLADISSSKAWSMNFALHSFAVRFFFSKRSFDTTSPSMLRIATSPCRRGLGSPHRVSGFARGSPTRRAVERERD